MFGEKLNRWMVKILEFKDRNCIVTNVYRFIHAMFPHKNPAHSHTQESLDKSYVVRDKSEEISKKVELLEREMRNRTPYLSIHHRSGKTGRTG